ncbi:MAG: HTH domain-containing protein [Streptosporangiaceae bacterium]
MSALADALDRSREMISGALAEARAELAALDTRRSELEALIAQGEAALGHAHGPVSTKTMTLHDALAQVLRENGNEPMTARALADAVNNRGLYSTRDSSPVEVNQIHARTNNYQDVFEKDGSLIRLKEESPVLTGLPQTISVFRDDDPGFFQWLDDHPDGYFINSERNPKPTYLVLHRPSCKHFDRGPVHWTKDYIKICSTDRSELEEWASGAVGGDVTLCRTCFG